MDVNKRLNETFANLGEEERDQILELTFDGVTYEVPIHELNAKLASIGYAAIDIRKFENPLPDIAPGIRPYPNANTVLADANMEDAIARATELLAATHQHEFTYVLNNNHTALRGCKCGLAFVGLMAGPSPDALQWHQIHEENEQG